MEETNINISLDDSRLKEIAEAITNKTCKKILNHLATNESTTSEISEELEIAINTIDYNIKKLIKTGLIEKKSYWWSVKGKKMPTYAVSNKKIIISPKIKTNQIKYFLALGITGLASLFIKIFSQPAKIIYKAQASNQVLTESASFARDSFAGSVPEAIQQTTTVFPALGFAGWFLIGAWCSILSFFLFSIITERRSSNEKRK